MNRELLVILLIEYILVFAYIKHMGKKTKALSKTHDVLTEFQNILSNVDSCRRNYEALGDDASFHAYKTSLAHRDAYLRRVKNGQDSNSFTNHQGADGLIYPQER